MARKRGKGRSSKRGVRRHEFRRRLLLLALVAGSFVVIGRAFQLSVVQHGTWMERAEDQHTDTLSVPAARGTIYDRDGVPLAASREVWIVAVQPREVADPDLVAKRLSEHVGLSLRDARRVVTGKNWKVLPGRHDETVRAALDGIAGIHFEQTVLRFYPHERLGSEVLGRVNMVGDVAGGIEQVLDSLLAGRDGRAVVRVDPQGHRIPGEMVRTEEPESGLDVVLTLDADLQEIATDALAEALDGTGAKSGEMLIADPYTGDILAAVSRLPNGPSRTWTAVTTPYEPGSTIKPFTVGSLLTEGLASLTDSIYAEQGRYRLHGRTIEDVHGYGWLTLREGFLQSSNIVMAKAASRLSRAQQYQRLRDFGFGVPTGIAYPSESGGTLRKPGRWSQQSQASLAFGYEIEVTPLQLVMAYAAIANGGVLMEPRLVREVRARNGRVISIREPRAVRRALPQSVAADLRTLMGDAVEIGTGKRASMGDWKVAGKTGTAKIAENGRYMDGQYVATFAGFFPAESPQLVFLVKLDRPSGEYYGGVTAAPVTRATLEAALAAHGTPLDRSAMATTVKAADTHAPMESSPPVDSREPRAVPVSLDPGVAVPAPGPATMDELVVPDVVGMPLREAARRMHEAGFKVRLEGSTTVRSTEPRAAKRTARGATVKIVGGAGG